MILRFGPTQRLDSPPTLAAKRKEQHIVIATSMWHESENEMVQWVRSLARVLEGVIDTAKRCDITIYSYGKNVMRLFIQVYVFADISFLPPVCFPVTPMKLI